MMGDVLNPPCSAKDQGAYSFRFEPFGPIVSEARGDWIVFCQHAICKTWYYCIVTPLNLGRDTMELWKSLGPGLSLWTSIQTCSCGLGAWHFPLNFHTKWLFWHAQAAQVHVYAFLCAFICVRLLCFPMCSHICALICVHSLVYFHMCGLLCVLS